MQNKNVITQSIKSAFITVFISILLAFSTHVFAGDSPLTIAGKLAPKNLAPGPTSPAVPDASRQKALRTYGKLPLSFEANQGQTDEQVKFLSRSSGYAIFLTPTEAVLALQKEEQGTTSKSTRSAQRGIAQSLSESSATPAGKSSTSKSQIQNLKTVVLRMKLVGADPEAQLTGMNKLAGKLNYFTSNDPAQWHRNIPTFSKVRYRNVYPGVDLVYYGNQQQLEYDFVVYPGANPKAIRLAFEGADQLQVDAKGELVLHTGCGDLRQRKPFCYQDVNGIRQEVSGGYVLDVKSHLVSFQVADYDSSKPLVIDPLLVYSTYLGGSGLDLARGVAVDASGNAYVTGPTVSADFPTTANVFQPALRGTSDAFVAKLNPTGTALVYLTYLGGGGDDGSSAIAVDLQGNAYLAGTTGSSDFPTVNPYQGALHGTYDTFVAKLNPEGSALIYSTYIGGSCDDYATSFDVDSSGSAYVGGLTCSADYPTHNAYQPAIHGSWDAFVTKLNCDGSDLVYSTYLGGSTYDHPHELTVDALGQVCVTGRTDSRDFPLKGSFQGTYGGGAFDVFLTKFDATGTGLVFSTFVGGSDREGPEGITTDGSGNVYLAGVTLSSDFPLANPLQQTFGGGGSDGFLMKFTTVGSVIYSSYLGGSGADEADGVAADSAGNAYLTGATTSTDFPTLNPFQASKSGGYDAFVAKVNPAGSTVLYSSYLGGNGEDVGLDIAVDTAGAVYVTGYTTSSDFPTTIGVFDASYHGDLDGFLTKLVSDNEAPAIHCPANITLACSVAKLVPATFSVTATDDTDASPRLTCTPPPGSLFPVGTTSVNCTATDASGNQSHCSFVVTRAPLGFTGFLAPIGGVDATGGSFADPLRTFKLKSTIPVKFSASCSGSPVLTGVHTLQAIKWGSQTDSDPAIDASPTDAATPSNQFRLVGSEWHFNLDTKGTGMSTGIWQLIATLSDGSQHTAWIQIK